jgi:hypothetical protein
MRLTFYPHDIQKSTAEFDASLSLQMQGDLFEHCKKLALHLNSRNKGTVAVAAVAIQQLADANNCSVHYVKDVDRGRYDSVVIETRESET